MSAAAIKHLDSLKPYKGGNEALWRVHELDNIDKHRTLFTIGRDHLFEADWIATGNLPYWLKADNPHFAGVFDPDVEQDVQLEIEEAITKPQVPDSGALLQSLRNLITFVEEVVLTFKPLLS